MKVDCIINESVTLVLSGESVVEEEILKALSLQDNHLVQVRSSINIISKQIRGSVLICKKESFNEIDQEDKKEDQKEQKVKPYHE